MNQQVDYRLPPRMVAQVMGVEEGALRGIAWLVIQEEAKGVGREAIARNLGCSESDIEELVHEVVEGKDKDESESRWGQGIVALKTAALMTQQMIEAGWDSIEAMALNKVADYLTTMQGMGDPEKMIDIAAKANKAHRRNRGESASRSTSTPPGTGDASMAMQLPDGSVGMMTLSLSPQVREQLSRTDRVVDGEKKARLGGLRAMEMLDLKSTRALIEENKEAEERKIHSDETPQEEMKIGADSFADFLSSMKDESHE